MLRENERDRKGSRIDRTKFIATGLGAVMGIAALAGCANREVVAIPEDQGKAPGITATETPTSPGETESNSPSATPTETTETTPEVGPKNPEMYTNAIDYDEIRLRFESLTEADVERLIANEDFQSIAEYIAYAYMDTMTNGSAYIATLEQGDCKAGSQWDLDNPLVTAMSATDDPRTFYCGAVAMNGVISTQADIDTKFESIERPDRPLDQDRANRLAEIYLGYAAAQDNYSADLLEGMKQSIARNPTVFSIDYEGKPESATFAETGKIEINGIEYDYKDVTYQQPAGSPYSGPQSQRYILIPLENPIIRERPLAEGQPGFYEPGDGEMFMEDNGDGTATPVARTLQPDSMGDFMDVSVSDPRQITIPFNVGSPSLYRGTAS